MSTAVATQNITDLELCEKHAIQQDPLLLVEHGFLKIKTKDGRLTFFYPNNPQRRFIKLVRSLLATKKPVSIVIDKARQWGGSTVTELILYSFISQKPNVNGLVIADDDEGAAYILDMSKLVQSELIKDYPHIAQPTARTNRRELAFENQKSRLFIQSARNVYAGQKYTLQFVHASEASKYQHAEELFAGLLPAVAKVPGSLRIVESTPNGIGNYFYKIVKEAESNMEKFRDGDFTDYDGEWILFFVSPWEHDEYVKPFRSEEEEHRFLESMDAQEKLFLHSSYETIDGPKQVTSAQLNWRRWELEHTYHGDIDQFNQYYPATVDIGFIVSGTQRFDGYRLKEMYEYAKTVEYQTGTLDFPTETERKSMAGLTDESVLFHPDPHGDWKIWEPAEWQKEYVMFVDPAGGEEIEGNPEGKKGDYNVIEVYKRLDLGRLEQVAEYRSRIDPDILGDQEVHKAWLAYSKPMTVGIEANAVGRTTVDHAKHKVPVYQREVVDEITRKVTRKMGWYTDNVTRNLMIDEMAAMIREKLIIMKSLTLISECMTFVRDSKGKYQAQEGCFDDCVMATAGAIQMHLRTPHKGDFKIINIRSAGARS